MSSMVSHKYVIPSNLHTERYTKCYTLTLHLNANAPTGLLHTDALVSTLNFCSERNLTLSFSLLPVVPVVFVAPAAPAAPVVPVVPVVLVAPVYCFVPGVSAGDGHRARHVLPGTAARIHALRLRLHRRHLSGDAGRHRNGFPRPLHDGNDR